MKKIRVVLFSTAVILSILLVLALCQQPAQAPAVQTVRAGCENIYNSVTVSGELYSARTERIAVPRFATVQDVMVKVGEHVSPGTPLFTICYETPSVDVDALAAALYELTTGEAPNTFAQAQNQTETVSASLSGIVMTVPDAGQQLIPGVVCANIADLSALQLRAEIPELYISGVEVGQKANFTLTAVPDQTFTAVVSEISPCAARSVSLMGTENRPTVEAVLTVKSGSAQLRPGYSTSIKIFTDRRADAVTVPYEAVLQEGEQEVVYRVQDGMLYRTPVETGYALSGGIEIRSGLAAGETVALPGDTALTDGLRVQTGGEA